MNHPLTPSPRSMVEQWNRLHPVGQTVMLRRDNGTEIVTRTRSEADMFGQIAVIWLRGVPGAYRLDRCRPITKCRFCGCLEFDAETGLCAACAKDVSDAGEDE